MIAEIIMYTGAAMVGLGILLLFVDILRTVWGKGARPDTLAKIGLTLCLVGSVLFFAGLLTFLALKD